MTGEPHDGDVAGVIVIVHAVVNSRGSCRSLTSSRCSSGSTRSSATPASTSARHDTRRSAAERGLVGTVA